MAPPSSTKAQTPDQWLAHTFALTRKETDDPLVTSWRVCAKDMGTRGSSFEPMESVSRPDGVAELSASIGAAVETLPESMIVKVEARARGKTNPVSQKVFRSPSENSGNDGSMTGVVRSLTGLVTNQATTIVESRDAEIASLRDALVHERTLIQQLRDEVATERRSAVEWRDKFYELQEKRDRDATLHYVARGISDAVAVRIGGPSAIFSDLGSQRVSHSLVQFRESLEGEDLERLQSALGPMKAAPLLQLLLAADDATKAEAKRKALVEAKAEAKAEPKAASEEGE